MRLDKFLCDTLNVARTEAKKMVSSGRVFVDGAKAKSGSLQLNEAAEVCLDGKPLNYQRYFYIMLNKPSGVVCANRDSKSKTVFDLLDREDLKKDLFVCGRLDKDTTGFVLLMNNGPLAHRLLAPKKDVYKEYSVLSAHPVTDQDIRAFENGIRFKDGTQCKPAYYIPQGDCYGLVRISEGKFHQIKKMFFAIDNEVLKLHRNSIHGLSLDATLAEGEYRYLTDDEITILEKDG